MSPTAWPAGEVRQRLAAPGATLPDLLEAIAEAEATAPAAPTWKVGLSANVTTELAACYFKKQAYLGGLRCAFVEGGYDLHLDNLQDFLVRGLDTLVLIQFFDNLVPAFEAQLGHMAPAMVDQVMGRVRSELHLVFTAARPFKAVYVPPFHRFTPPGRDRVEAVLTAFNGMLAEVAGAFPNVCLLAPSRAPAFNPRFYLAYKAPYAGAFWDELARQVLLASRFDGTTFYKALVVDGDNTLWGGVVGEDGVEGVALGPHRYPDNVFWTVQHMLLGLQQAGVLLCLCSKNNPADVAELLESHPHRVLLAEHFAVLKLSWRDKAAALREIAAELGLGLDALVFLDDSPFECEAVRGQLPAVKVVQVPKHLFEYPALVQEVAGLFPAAAAGADQTARYRARALALEAEASFPSHDAYLHSLGMRVEVRCNDASQAARAAELTQKSNQFNLTTRRYTAAEMAEAMADPARDVVALHMRDRFGDAGLTGVLVVHFAGPVARVETFLLSCRVLGRGLELAPWDAVFAAARARGCETVEAAYRASPRNEQVAGFYARVGLTVTDRDALGTLYAARLDALRSVAPPHIEVCHVG
ncbi:MAG: FkbH protein [Cyanobacteria bacterium RYN_339]|nr:FkbH protein [Cyanobacteria bacterium RYN_339]